MTDRELLEAAAKAAGLSLHPSGRRDGAFLVLQNENGALIWNPLTDDGDRYRLAAKLKMVLDWSDESLEVRFWVGDESVPRTFSASAEGGEGRAVCLAAAQIGASNE